MLAAINKACVRFPCPTRRLTHRERRPKQSIPNHFWPNADPSVSDHRWLRISASPAATRCHAEREGIWGFLQTWKVSWPKKVGGGPPTQLGSELHGWRSG